MASERRNRNITAADWKIFFGATTLKHPAELAWIVEHAEPDSLFELFFYGHFVEKTLAIMRRTGRDQQGFERMQQSVNESVQEMTKRLKALPAPPAAIERMTSLSGEGFQSLLSLVGDLAVANRWTLTHQSP